MRPRHSCSLSSHHLQVVRSPAAIQDIELRIGSHAPWQIGLVLSGHCESSRGPGSNSRRLKRQKMILTPSMEQCAFASSRVTKHHNLHHRPAHTRHGVPTTTLIPPPTHGPPPGFAISLCRRSRLRGPFWPPRLACSTSQRPCAGRKGDKHRSTRRSRDRDYIRRPAPAA
jgi:hypothetical protein